jgi:anti-sigma-K factor RskA
MSADDHVNNLIPAYALDSLEHAEANQVEQHLETCMACRRELAEYEAVTAQLGLAAPDADPPTELKQRLMERVRTPVAADIVTLPLPWKKRLDSLIQRALAAPSWQPVALLLIAALAISNVLLWQRVNQEVKVPVYQGQTVELSGTETAPEASGLIVISSDGLHGTLVVDDMPLLSEEQQYQLWLIRDGQRTSGAVFSVSQDGYGSAWIRAPQALTDYPSFGITVEPTGGSPGPTGAKILGSD